MIEEQGQVSMEHASAVFRELRSHLMEEGIVPEVDSAACFAFEYSGNRLRIDLRGDTLAVKIHALSDNILYFIKESVVQHIAEHNPGVAETFAWEKASTAADIPPNFQALTLVRTSQPMRGMRRLTCRSPDPDALTRDGMHVKLLLPPANVKRPVWPAVAASGRTLWPRGADKLHVRYYTLRDVRPDTGEVDIDVVIHAGGQVSGWAETATPGEQVGVMGPGGGIVPPVTQDLWLIGDSTALPAIARILETLDKNASGMVVCGIPDTAALQDYLPDTTLQVVAINEKAFHEDFLKRVLVPLEAAGPSYVWFGGEQSTYRAIKEFCQDRLNLPASQTQLSVYWKRTEAYDASMPEV